MLRHSLAQAAHSFVYKSKHMEQANSNNYRPSDFNMFSYHGEIQNQRLFCFFFREIPSIKKIHGIDIVKAMTWVEDHRSQLIMQRITDEYHGYKNPKVNHVTFVFSDKVLLALDHLVGDVEVLFYDHAEEAQKIIDSLKKFEKEKNNNNILIVACEPSGLLDLRPIKITPPNTTLEKCYNDDLIHLHESILDKLKVNESGLMLFHGEPGTGKSTYLRYLVSQLDKEIIFLSPGLAGNLDNPHFAKLLLDHQNAIIIVEDAEELLVARENEKNSGISMLLNLTDGLLGSCLNIQFICTFNIALGKIDKALLRKGRLKVLYEFTALTLEKTKELVNDLNKKIDVKEAMTIADIYGLKEERDFKYERQLRPVGFKLASAK